MDANVNTYAESLPLSGKLTSSFDQATVVPPWCLPSCELRIRSAIQGMDRIRPIAKASASDLFVELLTCRSTVDAAKVQLRTVGAADREVAVKMNTANA